MKNTNYFGLFIFFMCSEFLLMEKSFCYFINWLHIRSTCIHTFHILFFWKDVRLGYVHLLPSSKVQRSKTRHLQAKTRFIKSKGQKSRWSKYLICILLYLPFTWFCDTFAIICLMDMPLFTVWTAYHLMGCRGVGRMLNYIYTPLPSNLSAFLPSKF